MPLSNVPQHDSEMRRTAYMQGMEDYLAGKTADPTLHHGIRDAYRINLYVEGYAQECIDHMDAIPANTNNNGRV